jgi:hypothetical protein
LKLDARNEVLFEKAVRISFGLVSDMRRARIVAGFLLAISA